MPYFMLRRARKRYWMSCPSMGMPGRPGFTRNGIHFHSPFPIFPVAQPLSDLGCSKDNRLPYPIQPDHTSIWPELFMRPQVGWFLFNIHACQHVAVIASASYGTSGTNLTISSPKVAEHPSPTFLMQPRYLTILYICQRKFRCIFRHGTASLAYSTQNSRWKDCCRCSDCLDYPNPNITADCINGINTEGEASLHVHDDNTRRFNCADCAEELNLPLKCMAWEHGIA